MDGPKRAGALALLRYARNWADFVVVRTGRIIRATAVLILFIFFAQCRPMYRSLYLSRYPRFQPNKTQPHQSIRFFRFARGSERCPPKAKVVGSNPVGRANDFNDLHIHTPAQRKRRPQNVRVTGSRGVPSGQDASMRAIAKTAGRRRPPPNSSSFVRPEARASAGTAH